MRILAIRGRNLASLAGDFEIDLTAEPIAGTGLFAITGETGAGKSTILDCLSLALYAEHPRAGGGRDEKQPDPSGMVLQATDSRALLRRGTFAGFAEVDFLARDGGTYRARWAVNRARGKVAGNLQNVERSLVRLPDGSGVASGIRPVLEAVVRLTDLTFEQFRRTVQLAQGEFDAFLMADEKDRADLLERITGTGIYGDISRRVHEMRSGQQAAHDALKLQRERIGLLVEEERHALSAESGKVVSLAEAGSRLAGCRRKAGDLRDRQKQLDEQAPALAQAADTAREAADQAGSALAEVENEIAALEPAWREADRQDEALRQLELQRAAQLKGLGEAEGALGKTAIALDLAQKALDRSEAEAIRIAGLLAVRPDDEGLKHRQAGIRDRIGKRTGFLAEVAMRRQEQKTQAARLDTASKALAVAEAAIQDHQTGLDACLKERRPLEADLEAADEPALRAARAGIDTLMDAARAGLKAARDFAGAEGDSRLATAAREAAASEHMTFGQERDAALAEAEKQRAALVALDQSAGLAEAAVGKEAARLRSLLVAGESCPVCGATEHPHAHGSGELQRLAQELRGRRDAARGQVAANETLAARASQQAAAAAGRLEAAVARLAMAHRVMAETSADYAGVRAALAVPGVPDVLTHEAAARLLAIGTGLRQRRDDIDGQLARVAKLTAAIADTRRRETALRDSIETARKAEKAARDDQVEAGAQLAAFDGQIATLDDRLQSLARELAPDLALLGLEISAVDQAPNAALERLASIIETHERQVAERDRLEQVITGSRIALGRLESELQAAEIRLSDARNALVSITELLSEARAARALLLGGEETGPHRAVARARETAARRQADSARVALSETQAKQKAALEARERLSGEIDIVAAALAEATAAFEVAIIAAGSEIVRSSGWPLVPVSDQDQLPSLPSGEGASHAALAAGDIANLEQFITGLQQRAGVIREKLDRDDRAALEAEGLAGQLAVAAEALGVWNEVHEAIGSRDGDRFRRFAQGITLDHLVALANEHLAALSPRYRLARGEGSELSLMIIDRDMADERRSARSLSGGERFLVSLGLALALSGLEGRQTFVDTLFIDEGFGALDAETLDMAVDALEALQGRGRKVGVITHVAAMIERIAVKVLVEKRGGGRSEVRVVAG